MDKSLEEKFLRIQALIERAGTLSEAEAASAALQRLLLRHNLELSDLPNGERSPYGVETWQLYDGPQADNQWRVHLLHVLSHFNFCRVVYSVEPAGEVSLVGEDHNRALVRRWAAFLAPVYERLALLEYRTYRLFIPPDMNQEDFLRGFLEGCPIGLFDRLLIERETDLGVERVMALVLTKEDEVEAATQELIGEHGLVQVNPELTQATVAGYLAGRETRLEAPLEGPEEREALG